LRILEIDCPPLPGGIKNSDGIALRAALAKNCGHAGRRWAAFLVQPSVQAFIRKQMPLVSDEYQAKLGGSVKGRFIIRLLASIKIAAVLVKHADILDFSPQRVVDFAEQQAISYMSAKPQVVRNAIGVLGQFLNDMHGNIIAVPGPFRARTPQVIPLREPTGGAPLIGRFEQTPARLYVTIPTFRDWCRKRGHSYRAVTETLRRMQVLSPSHRNMTLAAGTNRAGTQVACLDFNCEHSAYTGMPELVNEPGGPPLSPRAHLTMPAPRASPLQAV
jgi:hypothetical protein